MIRVIENLLGRTPTTPAVRSVETAEPVVVEGDTTAAKDSFPYHEAKNIIEKARLQLGESLQDQELAPISFSREKDASTVSFEVVEGANTLKLLSEIAKTLGGAEIASYGFGSLCLSRKDGLGVWLNPNIISHTCTVSFSTKRDLRPEEIEAIINAYKLGNPVNERRPKPQEVLESLGAVIFDPEDAPAWDYLAGYEEVKQLVKETVLLPLRHPKIYEQVAQKTRVKYESIRPKAVLFEGPPGTGKTTMARVIAGEVETPLVYVPIESIMTKWYGESERNLAEIFGACEELGRPLLFLDEIDSLATTRDGDIHESTRRVLSVLLRKIDGFVPSEGTILIGATNRKKDLDPALLSRFDTSIEFPLPNAAEREAIFKNYAQQFNGTDLATLAQKAEGLSGRDIKNLCERVERRWAAELIANNYPMPETMGPTPPFANYLALMERK